MHPHRIAAIALATATAVATLVMTPLSGWANNDPHRSPVPAGDPIPLDATYCAFPVHIAITVDKEYQTVSADGATSTVTGSLVAQVTNDRTGKALTVNISGPGTSTMSTNGADIIVTSASSGVSLLWSENAKAFGFASNVVVTSGAMAITFDETTSMILSVTRLPHPLLDVCAALA